MGGLSGSAQNESFTRVRIRYHKSAPKKNGKQINKICKNSGLLLVKESVFFLPKKAGSLDTKKNQQSQSIAGFLALAGDEGFEPPQTESESGVLPLHKSPKLPQRRNASIIIASFAHLSSVIFQKSANPAIFSVLPISRPRKTRRPA